MLFVLIFLILVYVFFNKDKRKNFTFINLPVDQNQFCDHKIIMANQAIGMIETRGLCAMLEACDAALKAANVTMVGWEKIGSG